ncbi:MAG: hypothetical protein Q9201_005086 [Fulgogasparrea decipioides]
MDDLHGLNWTASSSNDPNQKLPPMSQGSYYPPLRPTPPLSGRSTPFSAPQLKPSTPGISRSNASTPANDSFANLVSFNAVNPNKALTLQEQQKRLQEERALKEQRNNGSSSLRQDEDFWEKLGSGRSTPNPVNSPPAYTATHDYGGQNVSKITTSPFSGIDANKSRPLQSSTNDNDLLSGLQTTQDSTIIGGRATNRDDDGHQLQSGRRDMSSAAVKDSGTAPVDDDDPFGLGSMGRTSQQPKTASQETVGGNDDVLGLLGRPVSEFSPSPNPTLPSTGKGEVASASPTDQALAELVDMGFSLKKSKQALATTESGADVQSAVGWLLNQAHQESRSQSRGAEEQSGRSERREAPRSPPRRRSPGRNGVQPAWIKDAAEGRTQQREHSRSPVNGEKDPTKIAAELGNNLFKTANSLWKSGTKKFNQAVADFNSDSDSSQPKWMREPRPDRDVSKPKSQNLSVKAVNGHTASGRPQRPAAQPDAEVTDEALMLESADARPPLRKPSRPKREPNPDAARAQPPASFPKTIRQDPPHPRFLQQSRSREHQDPRARLSKQAIEEQTAEAYISPARRKRTTPKPSTPESDLLFERSQASSTASAAQNSSSVSSTLQPARPSPSPRTAPSDSLLPPRPQALKRNIPPISPSALKTSHTSRQSGTLAFKRGDYAEATTHYTSALTPLASTHPLQIPVLTNRALSHLKTGDPKSCITDTTRTLELIGPARGAGEVVDLGNEEGVKDMFTYWGKAMTRQAEALEQLERWADAGEVWKSCVEAGVGGATSIAGRNRCQKAVRGPSTTPKPAAPKRAPRRPQPKASALEELSGTIPSSAIEDDQGEAVTRLRLANLEAERLDDEKFALSDTVSARISGWRSGKEGNLRALLASLDTVLWEGSGWKKVGMGELLVPGKVKVVYMKAVGRCHPDKLPTTATTEQKMVSAAVFATLNEAWDGFKRENGL